MRRLEEFYCDIAGGGCGKYFKTYLRESMYGNYSIRCPNCQHVHFRFIDKGLVTSDRHNSRVDGEVEMIVGLKSTIRDTPWHTDPTFLKSQIRVLGG